MRNSEEFLDELQESIDQTISRAHERAGEKLLIFLQKKIARHRLHRHKVQIVSGMGSAMLVIGIGDKRKIFNVAKFGTMHTIKGDGSHGIWSPKFQIIQTLQEIDDIIRSVDYADWLNDSVLSE
jgi:hypothetical protein